MRQKLIPILGMVLFISLCQYSMGVGASTPTPLIQRVEIDSRQRHLVISGSNFGDTAPLVALGGETLSVKRFSAEQVVAALPSGVRPATYRLMLTDARDATKSDSINLEISPSSLYRNTPRGR